GISPDGATLVSASEDRRVALWLRDGSEWRHARDLDLPVDSLMRRPGARHAVAFTPDGSYFATASHENRIALYSPTGDRVAMLDAHTDVVLSLAFASDGELLSSSWDGTIRAWDLA